MPSVPSVSTSPGPVGQSKATIGNAWVIASIMTIGRPSNRLLSA